MEQSQNPYPMDHWAQQSPIQLFRDESLFVDFPKGFLSIDYSGAPFAGTFQGEPGHKNFVLSKLSDDQCPPLVTLGGVTAELIKIHVHTPSEHELEGEHTWGEIHLVHTIRHPTAGSELLVLGVFFEVKAKCEESGFFPLWAASLKAAAQQTDPSDSPVVWINPRLLLPKPAKKWYRYEAVTHVATVQRKGQLGRVHQDARHRFGGSKAARSRSPSAGTKGSGHQPALRAAELRLTSCRRGVHSPRFVTCPTSRTTALAIRSSTSSAQRSVGRP